MVHFRVIKTSIIGFIFALGFGIACTKKETLEFAPPTSVKPAIPYYFESSYVEPADNPTTKEGIELGRHLFFETQLSKDGSISCASCHKPELAFTDGKKVSIGVDNQLGRRNAPSVYNTNLFKKLMWDGSANSLEEQSLHPIRDPREMNSTPEQAVAQISKIPKYKQLFGNAFGSTAITVDRMAKGLAQFERSLVSSNSNYDRFLKGNYTPTTEEQLGITLFFTHPIPFAPGGGLRGGNCGDCHLGNTLIGNQNELDGFHNNGLETSFSSGQDIGLKEITGNNLDLGKFKTPGLRNIALTAPYMHDGRFQTLEEVLEHYNHEDLFTRPGVDPVIPAGTNQRNGTSLMLTETEKKAIIAFLHMLTDSDATKSFQP